MVQQSKRHEADAAKRDQGRAANQASALDRTDRWRRSTTRRSYDRRRSDAGPSTRGGGSESGPARNRDHGSNRNIGFVHTGPKVEIKVNTFNFTCYGHASWQSDKLAVGCHHPRQTTCPLQRSNREPGQSQRDARTELGYAARISLDRTDKRVYEKRVKLSPAWP